MKELLLEDANKLHDSASMYEMNRRKIKSVEYKTFTLSETDFYNMVFMEANTDVWANNQTLIDKLVPAGKPRTLKDVVDRIVKTYPHETPIKIFKHLSEDEPWFDRCFIISARFDLRLFGELLIRPLTTYERPAHSPNIKFYLEDGNHRALVYAMSLRLEREDYKPVHVIWSSDWSHIYPWGQIP